MLGGALGDALGAAVEFMSLPEIEATYGPAGIRDPDVAYGRVGAITDDTQMTLFTAEGLIRAWVRLTLNGACHPPSVVAYAYQRWLHTQGYPAHPFATEEAHRGWLLGLSALHARRAPGMTCLSALEAWDHAPAENDSKGCGSVMRSAPFGFFQAPGDLARECSEITHGHVEAGAASMVLAEAVASVLGGKPLGSALVAAAESRAAGTLTAELVGHAVDMASADAEPWDAIPILGEGWVAEEALAIGAFCAVRAGEDVRQCLRWAVNHSGDSDSTGSICGNLMGCALGTGALPRDWLEVLELRDEISQVARDMVLVRHTAAERLNDRYPGC